MSVLIKNMEMPKCCLECPFEDSLEFDSYCIAKDYDFIGKWEDLGEYKPKWCPLQDASTVNEWISVSERLPDKEERVLVTDDDYIEFGKLINGLFGNLWLIWVDDYWTEATKVTAWMPLPKPYRKDDKR